MPWVDACLFRQACDTADARRECAGVRFRPVEVARAAFKNCIASEDEIKLWKPEANAAWCVPGRVQDLAFDIADGDALGIREFPIDFDRRHHKWQIGALFHWITKELAISRVASERQTGATELGRPGDVIPVSVGREDQFDWRVGILGSVERRFPRLARRVDDQRFAARSDQHVARR